MMRAVFLLALAGCIPQRAPEPPVPTPTIKESHPYWPDADIEKIKLGMFWRGMDVDQFECAFTYGFLSFKPQGPHQHRIFDRVSASSRGTIYGYQMHRSSVTGYFDGSGKLVDYTFSVY